MKVRRKIVETGSATTTTASEENNNNNSEFQRNARVLLLIEKNLCDFFPGTSGVDTVEFRSNHYGNALRAYFGAGTHENGLKAVDNYLGEMKRNFSAKKPQEEKKWAEKRDGVSSNNTRHLDEEDCDMLKQILKQVEETRAARREYKP